MNARTKKRETVYVPKIHEMPVGTVDSSCFVLDKTRGLKEHFAEKTQLVWLVRDRSEWVRGFFN